MKKSRKKIILTTVVVLLISTFLATTVFATKADKMIKAYYRNIKIFHNQKPVNIEEAYEPFIVYINGDPQKATTFVPLRAVSEMLGKEVKWDGKQYRIDINDKPDQEVADLMIQLISKDTEIKDLKNKVKELETKLAEAEKGKVSKTALTKTEDYLRKYYGEYEKIDFDIRLTDSKDEIKVSIVVDLDRDYSKWNYLRDRDIEDYVEKIIKEIQYDFKDVKISGIIEDYRTRDTLVEFYTNSRGEAVTRLRGNYGYIRDIDDMEDYLNREFGWYDRTSFDIKLSESKSSIVVIIEVDEYDWKDLRDKEYYLEGIYDAIKDNFSKTDVYGYVDAKGGGQLNSFTFDSRGYVTIGK